MKCVRCGNENIDARRRQCPYCQAANGKWPIQSQAGLEEQFAAAVAERRREDVELDDGGWIE